MIRIVYFDLATVSGWAFGSSAGVDGFGHFELPRTGENIGEYLCAAENHIGEIIGRSKADLVGFESPWLNYSRDKILNVRKLSGLANEVEKAAFRRRLRCFEATVDRVRRHFLGRDYPRTRDAAKIAVKVKAREMGYDVETDDEGDAVAGLSYMIAVDAPSAALAPTPLFQKKVRRK